jgi:hypothetical protein
MQGLGHSNKEIVIKINTEDLNATQIRLLKTINALLAHAITAEEEAEYFETSAELLKKCAEVIKHSNFADKNPSMAYGDQAVEFALDFINEFMDANKIHNIDN